MEKLEFKGTKKKLHIVEYAGFIHIQTGKYIWDADVLDRDGVGGIQAEANAKLFVAAKDLLEALIEVVRISDRDHEAWDKAKKAINKALK